MNNYVVTVTRQFGSLGRPIAYKLSQKLGIKYYDRDIVEKTAERMHLPVSKISKLEEQTKWSIFDLMKYPLGISTLEFQDRLFEAQSKIILELVEKGPCVVVGRCSDYVLSNYKNHIDIYIYAPFEVRLKNCIDHFNMSKEKAVKMIEEVDLARENYHIRYTHYLPDDPKHRDIMINSAYLGVDGTTELAEEIIRKKIEL